MSHTVIRWTRWIATASIYVSLISLALTVIDSAGNTHAVPVRWPALAVVMLSATVLKYRGRSSQLLHAAQLPLLLLLLILGTLQVMGTVGCIQPLLAAQRCAAFGADFRIQHLMLTVSGLLLALRQGLHIDKHRHSDLSNLFRMSVIALLVGLPLLSLLMEVSLNAPILLNALTWHVLAFMTSMLIALSLYGTTYEQVDPHPAFIALHSTIPVLLLLFSGITATLLFVPSIRDSVSAVLVAILVSPVALISLIIGFITFIYRAMLNAFLDPGAAPPPPMPTATSEETTTTAEQMITPTQEFWLQNTIRALAFILLIVCAWLLIRYLRRRLSERTPVSDYVETERTSLFSWRELGSDLGDLFRRNKKPTLATLGTGSVAAIRRLYQQFLRISAQAGYARPDHATPRAHAAEVTPELDAQAVASLTTAYEQARYGPEPDAATVQQAQAALQVLKQRPKPPT